MYLYRIYIYFYSLIDRIIYNVGLSYILSIIDPTSVLYYNQIIKFYTGVIKHHRSTQVVSQSTETLYSNANSC